MVHGGVVLLGHCCSHSYADKDRWWSGKASGVAAVEGKHVVEDALWLAQQQCITTAEASGATITTFLADASRSESPCVSEIANVPIKRSAKRRADI